MSDSQTAPKEDLVIVRILDAPVELVWKAWTEPKHVMRWWGPKYYASPSCKVDLREGGKFIFAMQAPEEQGGAVQYTAGIYEKIVPMELLIFTQHLSDAEGNWIDPAEIGMPPDFPERIPMRIEFKAKGQMTELTITQFGWTVGQMAIYAELGLRQSIDKMAASLQ